MSDDIKNNDEQPELELVNPAEEETQEEAADELKDQLLRALAEVENIRRRAARDHEDAKKYAIAGFARDLLSVADNFARALESVAKEDTSSFPASVQSMIDGLKLTEKELNGIFERQGVKKLNPLGEPFDHAFHQAIFEVPTSDYPAGTVAQVMQPGYVLHDRLLRPAMVGVAKEPE
jgi:molecular chaperone GrpE